MTVWRRARTSGVEVVLTIELEHIVSMGSWMPTRKSAMQGPDRPVGIADACGEGPSYESVKISS